MRSLGRWALVFLVVMASARMFGQCPTAPPTLVSPPDNSTTPFGPTTLNWDAVPNTVQYDVWYWFDGDTPASPAQTVTHPNSQANTTSIPPGYTMLWKVVAKKPTCTDQISAVWSFTTSCPTILPTLLQPVPNRTFNAGDEITFNWTPAPGASSYDVKVTPDHGATWQVIASDITGTSFATDDIPEGDWGWEVRVNFDGNCDPLYSAPSNFFVTSCNNDVPEIAAPANGATVTEPFTLTWTDVDAPSYKVWIKQGNANPVVFGTTQRNSMLVGGLTPGVYSFAVTADFTNCTDLTSAAITITVQTETRCPANPGKAALLSPPNGATNLTSPVTFSWGAVPDATGYRLLAAFDGGEAVTLGTTTSTSITLPVPKGTGYWIVQTLFGEDCPTTLSERRTLSVATGATCTNPPPQLLTPANGATNVESPVEFSWGAVPGALGYLLYVGINDATKLQLYGATEETEIERLVPDGKIYWAVAARFAACAEQRSEVRSFTAGRATTCPQGTIQLTSPANDAEVASPVRLSWTAVANVQFYRVWAALAGSAPGILARTNETSIELSFPGGTIGWFVEGVREGCESILSEPRKFRVRAAENCGTKPVPVLVSPLGTRENPGSATSPVTLKWNAVEGALAYRAWLAENGQPFADLPITTQTQTVVEVEGGLHVWFVQALFTGCEPTSSPGAFFRTTDPDRCTDTRPTLIQPAQNASVEANVTFRWSAVPGAEAYRVFVAREGSEEPLLIGKTDDTELTRLLPPATYIWLVEAVIERCPSTLSPRGRFTVARGTGCSTAKPELVTPANGATLTENPVLFSWSPLSGAIRYGVIARINDGAETLLGLTTETSLSRRVPAGKIEWRVIAFFAGCDPVESNAFRFELREPSSCANRAPILLVPADGTSVPSPLRFAWTDVPRATGYKLWVVQGDEEPSVVASTTEPIALVKLPTGRYEWFVEAQFANCPPTVSARSTVVVTPAEPCGTPRKPEAQVIGQALSGTEYRVRWTPLANVSLYEIQEATKLDFSDAATFTTDDFSRSFVHEVTGAPVQYLYRVRGISSCNDARGPYSNVVGVFVVAPTTNSSTSEIGARSAVVQKIFLPGGTAPLPFTVKTDKPWVTVTPASGTLPVEGLTLTVTADPSVLALGTNTGTIQIEYGSSAKGVTANGTTASIPVSVSLVTPVTPAGTGTPTPDTLIFPIVGHAVGANNSLFESDIRITNLTANTMKYDVHFTPSGVDGTETGTTTTIELAPNATLALDDVVASVFGTGSASATGTLEVRPVTTEASSGGGLLSSITSTALRQLQTAASSRTYNFTPNGTFGQYIPAIPYADFVGRLSDAGTPSILSLQQIAQSVAYRSNFGFAEAAGQPVDLEVRVFDTANVLLKTINVSLRAREHRQINGMLSANGITNLADGRVEVQVMNGEGRVTAYASTVDNLTNDPLAVNATLLGAATSGRYVLPGMAYINNGAAFWVSDVRLFNSGNAATPATLSFHPQGNPGAALTRDITLNAGEIRVLDNIIGSLFSQPNGTGGALVITTPQPTSLVTTARTYNQTSSGTYGQFIPGVTPAQSAGLGDRALQVLQLEQSSRFRTNIGVNETSGQPVTVEIAAIVPDSIVTPFVTIALAPNEFRQISLADFGFQNAVYNARVTVKVIDGTGKVTAYGSAIDLVTQDPTYVPAQ